MWEMLTEEERADLLGGVVQVVQMTEKESITLELLPMPHSLDSYSNKFALKSYMEAQTQRSVNYPDLYIHDFDVPRPSRRTVRAVG